MKGDAIGLSRTLCITEPHTARPNPASNAIIDLGSLILQITRKASSVLGDLPIPSKMILIMSFREIRYDPTFNEKINIANNETGSIS